MHVIYGGTFDPVHHGHLRMALEVGEALGVSQVNLVPSHIPPHRGDTGASAQQRLEMIRLAIAGEPRLVLDEREVRREGASYTADTLRQLRQELGAEVPLVMVVGTDAFASFDRWRDWQQILQLAHIVVVQRPGAGLPEGGEAGRLVRDYQAASVRELQDNPAGRVMVLNPPLLDISATGIRERIAGGRSIRYLTPDAVWQRIETWALYRPPAGQG